MVCSLLLSGLERRQEKEIKARLSHKERSLGVGTHDLRHSHVSLLIEMGFSAVAIADRVGHESIDITYKYAHLFPSKQQEMVAKLNIEREER